MKRSAVEVILLQQQRVDASARLATRFLDESASASLRRLSLRLSRLAATAATPTARQPAYADRFPSLLERLVRDVGLVRIDDPLAIARVDGIIADIEEMLNVGRAAMV